ncbi:MAG: thioredoxin family protein [Gammaproteobacteria bacterium]|nr:thioredoxin family protein [Gammaproteobacteria bacterium]
MLMDIQLVLTRLSSRCQETETVWQSICDELGFSLHSFDIDSAVGQKLIDELGIMTFPALIVNNKVVAVGRPDKEAALKILQSQIEKVSEG